MQVSSQNLEIELSYDHLEGLAVELEEAAAWIMKLVQEGAEFPAAYAEQRSTLFTVPYFELNVPNDSD